MSQIQANLIQFTPARPTFVRCRFEMAAAGAPSIGEFCAFEFPGCEGCPNSLHAVKTIVRSEDPLKLKIWRE
jgi:hypothetical protein